MCVLCATLWIWLSTVLCAQCLASRLVYRVLSCLHLPQEAFEPSRYCKLLFMDVGTEIELLTAKQVLSIDLTDSDICERYYWCASFYHDRIVSYHVITTDILRTRYSYKR
jgi:hypothetical protein